MYLPFCFILTAKNVCDVFKYFQNNFIDSTDKFIKPLTGEPIIYNFSVDDYD